MVIVHFSFLDLFICLRLPSVPVCSRSIYALIRALIAIVLSWGSGLAVHSGGSCRFELVVDQLWQWLWLGGQRLSAAEGSESVLLRRNGKGGSWLTLVWLDVNYQLFCLFSRCLRGSWRGTLSQRRGAQALWKLKILSSRQVYTDCLQIGQLLDRGFKVVPEAHKAIFLWDFTHSRYRFVQTASWSSSWLWSGGDSGLCENLLTIVQHLNNLIKVFLGLGHVIYNLSLDFALVRRSKRVKALNAWTNLDDDVRVLVLHFELLNTK